MGNQLSQLTQIYPPKPTFTEHNLPDQSGKTFIITGGSSGIGEQLAYILYKHNAKIYIAARSEENTRKAIERVKARVPHSGGQMIFLHLDLNDLTTIKRSADEFLNQNDRLDVLWNNAGVMTPPQGSKTKQGYELQLGTNNVAPFLFTKFLRPILTETAKKAPADSVRVVWVSSNGSEVFSEKGGVDLSNMDYKTDKYSFVKYGASKAGNIYHGSELARRAASEGIISVVRTTAVQDKMATTDQSTVAQPRSAENRIAAPSRWMAAADRQLDFLRPHLRCLHRAFCRAITQDHQCPQWRLQ